MSDTLPAHSPLGASSAERWMNCPGSVGLLRDLKLPESDEPDYRREGTAAHEAAAHLLQSNAEAWELIGQKFYETEVTVEMSEAIQVYLDRCRAQMALPGAEAWFEERVGPLPEQPLFFGTADCAILAGDTLYVNDYKHGQGVVVEVDDNPQVMYYAYGVLRRLQQSHDIAAIKRVVLTIVQPRGFHVDGPVREWETTPNYIRSWAEGELFPAMERTAFDHDLDAGKWCRFCPAKLVCPLMKGLFEAAMTINPKTVVDLTLDSLARDYEKIAAVEQFLKALKDETFRRLNLGQTHDLLKLVHKKANRVWKPEAAEVFKARFGDQAYEPASLKSPAEMEKVAADAKPLVKEWAYTPTSGLTVALASAPGVAVRVETTADTFSTALTQAGVSA